MYRYIVVGKIENTKDFAYYVGLDQISRDFYGMKIIYRQAFIPFDQDILCVEVEEERNEFFVELIKRYNLKSVIVNKESD